jgi:hypothetical protein
MINIVFEGLKPYLKGVKQAEDYKIVEVDLTKSWLIPDNNKIKGQQKQSDGKTESWIFYSDEIGFDEIIDWLKNDVIDMNIELEEKESLLKSKVDELKQIFNNSTLEELKNLKFNSEEDVLKLGQKELENKNKPSEVVDGVIKKDDK